MESKPLKQTFLELLIIIVVFAVVVGIYSLYNLLSDNSLDFVQQKDVDEAKLEFISGTEYLIGETPMHNGSTIINLRDSKNKFINTTCYLTIVQPDRTIYLPETIMLQDFAFSEYYKHWEVPQTMLGLFSQEVKCLVKNENISSSKAFHVANMTNILLTATNNLSQQINLILDTLNCSQTPYDEICERLLSINNSINNINTTLIFNGNVNATINFSEETINNINLTTKLYYSISANDCILNGNWIFDANVTNEENEILPFLSCNLETNVFGNQTITFNRTTQTYKKIYPCSPEGVTNWDFSCVRT